MQIVKISTFKGQCSGIIISCNNAREEKHNYYLIITVAHLCKDLFEKIEEKKEQKNIKNYICFDILNTEKNLISEKDYEIEDYFVSESLLNEDDILCFFVKIKDLHHIDGEVMVSDSGSLGDVMTEGFPNISNSQMIDLKGTVCKKTDEINHIYSYRISDDYHYYGTISDLIVMEGLSGAPVLTENNRLLGINQSIPYFSNGENPFKIVNYMDINHIFDFLRENSCIVYSLIDNVLKLKWIKTKNENNKKNSYYISEELKYDFTCREVFWPEDIEEEKAKQGENYKISEEMERMLAKVEKNREKIIKQFARFSFNLHENGVEFEDYSPGNVLIKDKSGNYEFYLVDLNRMKFNVKLNLNRRMKNVSRMMENEKIARIFADEYAKCYKQREEIVFRYLRYYIRKHKRYVDFMDITRPFRNIFKRKK